MFFVLASTSITPAGAQQSGDASQSKADRSAHSTTTSEAPGAKPRSFGSPYVELDSWVYPAIERLAALGYIHDAFLGMRPWTRIECAHLTLEAGDATDSSDSIRSQAEQLQADLKKEFQTELNELAGGKDRVIRLESVYANLAGISGTPLNDSYHFGQTIINNYGRPYEGGFNANDGFSGYTSAGRFTIYVRGEYQHAPSAPAYSLPVRQVIAAVDDNPLLPAAPVPTTNQFRLLDTYVSANVANWNLAFGKQSLWWGPGDGGALLFSDNAEPIYMFRASRITPLRLPWIFRWLGPMKLDLFYGQLSGNQYPPRPMIHGEKISFKPTPNLELGFSRIAEFGGVGRPITAAAVWNSYVSFFHSSVFYASNDNPGKRTGGFDFSYRVPFVRNWLTVYTDALSADDPSPLGNPSRAAFNPGIYMPRLPGLPKLDFRVEAVYTNVPTGVSTDGQFVYFDHFYHDLYTNQNNIIGSWIGREGQGFQAQTTYWFSPRNTLQVGYRHAKVASDFIPGGETVNDGFAKLNWWMRSDLSVSAFVQYEKWLAPILAPAAQTNWTSSVEVTYWPRSWNW
ncbi:MAG TPA: capsule assembly Wzi family protein [Candidatus Acidoferrum sp.]|nr:capsule assembly Wzi family protein [Candidatus Acidoferrum sp.]